MVSLLVSSMSAVTTTTVSATPVTTRYDPWQKVLCVVVVVAEFNFHNKFSAQQ